MLVYSYVFSTLAVYGHRAGLVTPDSTRDRRKSTEVNLK